jgi:hypothetical protein
MADFTDPTTAGAGFGRPNPPGAPEKESAEEEAKRLAELGNPYDIQNPKALETARRRLDVLLGIDGVYRHYFEREWFRNILYYAGKQWIIFDNSTRRFRAKNLPEWFPTPITNKYAEKADDLMNAFLQQRPPINYVPATAEKADIATAEIADRFRTVFYEESLVDQWEDEMVAWLVLTGSAYVIPYYDDDSKYGVRQIDTPEGPKVYPIGSLKSDVISNFEMRIDPRIRNMQDQHRFARLQTLGVDLARENWKEFAGQISADKEEKLGQIYLDALAYVTTSFGGTSAFGVSGTTSDTKNPRTSVYEFNELPTEEFPKGLRIVRVGKGGPIVELGPLPYKYGAGARKGQPFLNIVQFGLKVIPGRHWRKTPMDDLVTIQSYRNLIEAVIKLTVQRTGNSTWLNPVGSNVENISGQPGEILDYMPVSLGGSTFAKPERIPAELSNVQPLIILQNKLDDSMERIAGTFFLQGGDTPPGVTAASALAYLGERAERSMSPAKRAFAKSWKQWEGMNLEIARANWNDERIVTIVGRNKKWETKKFLRADLAGNVNLSIDWKALFPKSTATQRATIAHLIQLAVVNPQDPQQQYKILEAFGETALKGSESIDVQEAIKEWDEFLENSQPPIMIPLVQNSVVHIIQHADVAKTDEFKEMLREEPEKAQMWLDHLNAHYTDFMVRQATMGDMSGETPDGGEGKPSSRNGGGNDRSGPVKKGEDAAAKEVKDPKVLRG